MGTYLRSFFCFHVIAIPFVIAGLVVAHNCLLRLDQTIQMALKLKRKILKGSVDGIPFHTYPVHDVFGLSVFFLIFAAVIFFAPELGDLFEYNNFIPADPLVTLICHLCLVFYSVLLSSRAVTDVFTWALVAGAGAFAVNFVFWVEHCLQDCSLVVAIGLALTFRIFDAKFWGVAVMGGAVLLFLLRGLISPLKSIRYRPGWHKSLYAIFVVNFLFRHLGVQHVLGYSYRSSRYCVLLLVF